MASTTVLVTQLTGQAWIRDTDGNLIPLREGMRIPIAAQVVTASGSMVELQADGRTPFTLGESQDISLNTELFSVAQASEAAVTPLTDPALDSLLASINAGQDPLQELEPTAATLQGGSAGGSTFVRLNAVLEATTPLGLAYPRLDGTLEEDRLGGVGGATERPLYVGVVTLTSQVQVTEGGKIIVTATVDNAPQGTDLVITLRTGEVITIRVGETSGFVEIPTRTDDAYLQGTDPHVFEIGSTTGGGYDQLSTTSTTTTNVVDDQDATEIVLTSDQQVTEGGKITVTATVDKAPQGSDLVITLKSGETITIKEGQLTGSVEAVARADDAFVQGTEKQNFEIGKAEGGNYEALDTSSTTATDVLDDVDTVTVKLTATTSTSEDGGAIVYTASLVDAKGQPVTTNNAITVTLKNGEVITIGAGTSTADSTPVAVNRDDVYLEDDSISNQIAAVSEDNAGKTGALEKLEADTTAVKTQILDDSDPVYAQISVDKSAVFEGGALVYTVSLVDAQGNPVKVADGKSVTVSLDWSGAAANNADVSLLPQTVTINAGQTAAPNFTVKTTVDAQDEYREALTVSISGVKDHDDVSKGFEDLQISKTGASASSTVVDKPAISGQVTVYEKGLTSTADTSESASGVLKVSAGSGLDSIKINGETISLSELQNLGAGKTIVISGHGELTITGFTSIHSVDGKDVAWDISYSYTLTNAQTHAQGLGTNNALKDIALEVVAKGADGKGTESSKGVLGVTVVDDVPTIETEAGVQEPSLTTDDADLKGGKTDQASVDFSTAFVVKSENYGADGLGATPISWRYALSVVNGTDSGLKSGGQSITLQQQGDGKIVGMVGGKEVFSVSVDASGKVTLVQTGAIDHKQLDSSNYKSDTQHMLDELVKLKGTATITDSDGDQASHSTSIDIGANLVFTDDGPSIGAPSNVTVEEKHLATGTEAQIGPVVMTGSLAVDFGADNAASAKAYFTEDTVKQLQDLGLKSNGSALDVTLKDGVIVARAGGQEIFRLEITDATTNKAGYQFTLKGALDHVDGKGQQVNVLDLPISFEARDSDGDTAKGQFQVTVVDDVERTELTISVDEDSSAASKSNTFVLGADVAAGEIKLLAADGVTVLTGSKQPDGSTVYTTGHGLQGTVTVHKDGSISYVPIKDYSNQLQGDKQYAADELKFAILKDDGSTIHGTVKVNVNAVADAPVLGEKTSVTTDEDVAVALLLKTPTTSDATDQSAGTGDNPERLGAITLSGFPVGAKLLDAAGNVLHTFAKGDTSITIKLSDGNHTTDGSSNATLTMTRAEFEALKVLPPAESGKNFTVKVEVTSYEVDESGVRLGGVNGESGFTTVEVKVQAVTDPIELKINGQDSHALTIKEDSSYNLTPLLKVNLDVGADGNTTADVDGSEVRWLEVTGLPVGSYVNGTLITNPNQVVKVNISSKDASSLPKIEVTPPKEFSGDINGIKVTLKSQDKDSDGPAHGKVLEDSVTLNLHVDPVAGDVVVDKPKAIPEDTEVAFMAGVRVTDTGTEGGTELITKLQFALPEGWALTSQPDAGSAGGAVWTVTGTGSHDHPYVIQFSAGSEAEREQVLGQFKLTPPAHSSKDATIDLSITTVDSAIVNGKLVVDEKTVTRPVEIAVTPVAESTGKDSDGNKTPDLTVPTEDHRYAEVGKEDTVFDLNIESTALLNKAGWKNEDADETTTVLLTPVKLSADGQSSSPAIGSVFTWDGGSETYNGKPVEVPLDALASLKFQAPHNDAGTFEIRFQAQTVDYDDDHEGRGTADTAVSDAATLTIKVAPDADLAALSVKPAQGLEDTAIALSIRPSSSDDSETFNVSIAKLPDGATLHYKGVDITADTTGVSGISVVKNGGTWTVEITDFQQSAALTVTPPINSNVDFGLEVKTQAVDALPGFATSTGAWSNVQTLPVKVVGVADDASLEAKAHTYTEADLDSGKAQIQLGDLIQSVKQVDTDGSEKLSFQITGLPDGFSLAGARYIGGTGADRVWSVASEAALKAITISGPENFSGTVSIKVTPVTTENDGNWKAHQATMLEASITPSPESKGADHTTLLEDRESAVNFSINVPQGENETLTHVHIKVEDFTAKGFQLFLDGKTLDAAGVKVVTDAKGVQWYVLDADQAGHVTAKPTTENKANNQVDAPDLQFTIKYEVTDSANDGTASPVAPVTTVGNAQDYHLHVTPVTDQVAVRLDGIVPTVSGGASLMTDTSGAVSAVTLGSPGKFNVGIVLSSADQDGSESLIQVLVTGVPNGLTVDGLSIGGSQVGTAQQLDNGKWLISVAPSQLSAFNAALNGGNVEAQVSFSAGSVLSNATNTTIAIQVFSKDDGASNLSDALVQYELNANYTGGGQPGTSVQLNFEKNQNFAAKEDTAFTLDKLFNASISDNPSGENVAFTLSLKLPVGAKIAQNGAVLTATKVGDGSEELWLISGTAKTPEDLQALLSKVVVTPPEDLNDHFGGLVLDATFSGHVVSTGEQTVVKIHDSVSLSPETDGVSAAVLLSAADGHGAPTSEHPKEGSDIAIQVNLSRSVDGPSLLGDVMLIKLVEGAGFSGGKLFYGNQELTPEVDGSYKLTLDTATQIALLNGLGTSISGLHYQPADGQKYVNGSLKVEVSVQSKEQNAPEWNTSEGWANTAGNSATVLTDKINNSFEFTSVGSNDPYQDGSIGTVKGSENQSGTSLIALDVAGKLLDADGSELIHTVTLENLPNGFLVYYVDATGAQVQATNTGSSWSIPVDGMHLPAISIQAPQNWSGTLDNLGLRVLSGEASTPDKQRVDTTNFKLEVAAKADGFETNKPVVEQSFGLEGSIIALNLNLAMKDRQSAGAGDSSQESVVLVLTGLGEHASFFVGKELYSASYDKALDTYTLSGLKQTDLDNLGFIQAKEALTDQNTAVSGIQIGFTAHTVDGADVSDSITGSFNLTLSNQSGAGLQLGDLSSDHSNLIGGTGDDILKGGAGDDVLRGGAGNDVLEGGRGNDVLVGGSGNDLLTGGEGDDVFVWKQGDEGGLGLSLAAKDVVTDFGKGHDVLDLADLLQGDNATNLDNYLNFSKVGGDTVLQISTHGKFDNDAASYASKVDQQITLQGVDLLNGYSSEELVKQMISDGRLKVD